VKPSWNNYGAASRNGALALVYCLGRTLIRHTQQQTLGGDVVCKLPDKSEERVPGAPRHIHQPRMAYLERRAQMHALPSWASGALYVSGHDGAAAAVH
jgi:hypothetical protein